MLASSVYVTIVESERDVTERESHRQTDLYSYYHLYVLTIAASTHLLDKRIALIIFLRIYTAYKPRTCNTAIVHIAIFRPYVCRHGYPV